MTDFVDVSQEVIEVLSLEEVGSNFIDVSQEVIEVLSFGNSNPPVWSRLESINDGLYVNMPDTYQGLLVKIGD